MAEYYCDFRNAQSFDDLKNMLNKFFSWFFENLDSLNIKSITTEMTNVHSKNGETTIQGPMLVMKDSDGVTRLELGLNSSTGDFLFTLYNALGAANIQLDSTANGDGIITGGTVRTAATGERVELSGNQLKTYNSSNQLNGLVTESETGTGKTYGDGYWFDAGLKVLEIYNNLLNEGYTIRPANGASLFLGTYNADTYLQGNIRQIAKIGFFGADPVEKTVVSTQTSPTASASTNENGSHSHGGSTGSTGGEGLPYHSHSISSNGDHSHDVTMTSINNALDAINSKLNTLISALNLTGIV